MRLKFHSMSLLVAATFACEAAAQSYPSKPIRVIVGQAPGGATDIVSRALAQKLTDGLGQTVVIDNRSGAAGSIGSAIAASAPPDGYTALIVSSTYTISSSDTFAFIRSPRSSSSRINLEMTTSIP